MPIRVNNLNVSTLQQIIEVEGERILAEKKAKGLRAMGKKAIELIRDRASKGLDANGKRIPRLTRDYEFAKRQMIRGRWKFPRGPKNSQFRARSTPNHGRLTGQLFGSMAYVVNNGRLFLTLKGKLAKDKVQWLASNKGKARNGRSYSKAKREIWGLASPDSNQGKKEREELKKAFYEAIK